jgi:very-short-patch-repair endonuclease
MTMTPEAKSQLSTTIRALRARLLDDLHAAVEGAYRMKLGRTQAGLSEVPRTKRQRLEEWIDEQVRIETSTARKGAVDSDELRERFRRDAEKQAAYTLLNRLVLLRLMEAPGPDGTPLRSPPVVTKGFDSQGYKALRDLAPALRNDDTEGFAFLLKLVFDDLAVDLPGLFGSSGVAALIPLPASTLRHVVEALDDPELASCWTDDMTLGWVYQYWNDPEREAIDAKLNAGGKVEPHEIASKTQMFTERYMVDWLLQNSLGPMWLSLCRRHGWTADVLLGDPGTSPPNPPAGTSPPNPPAGTSPPNPLSINGEGEPDASPSGSPLHSWRGAGGEVLCPSSVLGMLEARRVQWRAKRDAGEVSLTALMPLHSDIERRWAYYLPQPLVDDDHAPDSVRDWKLIDPAVGSGHFLVCAFELLFALYQEEARHRGASDDVAWQPKAIVESILENNLHGIDLDPRAVQIAAAALWVKAQQTARDAEPRQVNLVASALRLANLPDNDPALVELRKTVEADTGVPAALTDTIVQALRGADHLGSLLKVDGAVDAAMRAYEMARDEQPAPQGDLFRGPVTGGASVSAEKARYARALRGRSSGAEETAWEVLRDRRLHGLKFRRQQPLAGFIVDFFCVERGLILEIDGGIHDDQHEADAQRTAILESRGFRVVRIRNDDVTVENLRRLVLEAGTSPPGPLSIHGEGEPDRSGSPLHVWRGAGGEVFAALERFLAAHTKNDELGLRLHGEQLATGVRFVRMLKEGSYDLVVGNPPYQGTAKMKDASYVAKNYPKGKADLYAAFLERGLQLVREGGTSSLLTMRNWMFIKQYAELRQWLLETFDLRALGDLDKGAFESMTTSQLISICMSIFRRAAPSSVLALAIQPTAPGEKYWGSDRTELKRAAVLAAVGRFEFETAALRVVPEWPLVYWWSTGFLTDYQSAPLLGAVAPARKGLSTGDNSRFLRRPWECEATTSTWFPLVKGAEGRAWVEAVSEVMNWWRAGLEVLASPGSVLRNPQYNFRRGVAFSMIGATFSARVHRLPSLFEGKGSSVFPINVGETVCSMNSRRSRTILESLNPGIGFEVGDVNRLPLFPIVGASEIFSRVEAAFEIHDSHREPSVEFKRPGPSPWRHAQAWAQLAVDRADGEPLPPYVEVLDPEPDTDHVSFALGVAVGRFGRNGEGISGSPLHSWRGAGGEVLPPETRTAPVGQLGTSPPNPLSMNGEGASGEEGSGSPSPFMERGRGGEVLPAGLCFLDGTLDAADTSDSLGQPACALLRTNWAERGPTIDATTDLRTWLRLKFFPDVHKGMYENRPIHWPLSSKNKTFVAWVNIHRMNDSTLRVLLADHLEPTKKRLDGELIDLRAARDGADKKAAKAAEKRFAVVQKAREELEQFIADVEACAERGAPITDAACKPRERDARYAPDLDDGVMINSAALWPLLEPQWKDPKKWFKELSNAQGKKDYDWSHLAMRYWPKRVDEKCKADPSLGVAHGCFWRYHPARAWAWELRLQDEIGPTFRIEEQPYRGGHVTDDEGDAPHRAHHLSPLSIHGEGSGVRSALEAVEKEVLRRARKQKKPQAALTLLEAGLWSAEPDACWAMELRLSEKQGVEFFLRAPDEDKARKAFLKHNPAEVVKRQQLVSKLQPLMLLPDEEEAADDDEGADDDEASE